MRIHLPLFKASSADRALAAFATAFASRGWWIAFAMLAASSCANAANVVLLQNTVVDNNALNFSSAAATFNRNVNGRTYQRFPLATFKGYQYATYYNANRNGGCGGGGAGDSSDGGDAVEGTAGLGGTEGGGDGAGGVSGNNSGKNGSNPGGGGGGAKSQSSGPKAGGTGGLGQIVITYVVIPVVEAPVLDLSMSGGDMVLNWTGDGFKVQSRTNLVEGAWQDVPGGTTPPVTNFPADPECFYRLIQQ